MSSPKKRKVTPNSSTSLRHFKNQKPTPLEAHFIYNYEESENDALGVLFTRLFNQLTEAGEHKHDWHNSNLVILFT